MSHLRIRRRGQAGEEMEEDVKGSDQEQALKHEVVGRERGALALASNVNSQEP